MAEHTMQKSPEKIVQDLYADFYNNEIPTVDGHKTGLILSHHAALLAAIARKDSETAERNIRIQNKLIVLTVIILILTLVSSIRPALQFYQDFTDQDEGTPIEKPIDEGN